MNKGIKMSDCRFYINEDDRTVICVIPKTKYMLVNYISSHFDFPGIDLSYLKGCDRFYRELLMPTSFMGKAVCSASDEWNEETGKLIAFSRAKDKAYKSFFKRANHYVQTIDRRLGDIINDFNSFGLLLEDKREGLEQRIQELSPSVEEE